MYKLKDMMEMLSIPERTIRRHMKQGLLSGTKVGGIWTFSQEEVQAYIGSGRVQKHIKDEGLKVITDFYRGHVVNKKEVVFMVIKEFDQDKAVEDFFRVTRSFRFKFSMNCHTSGKTSCITFKGQTEDLKILMKWSDEF